MFDRIRFAAAQPARLRYEAELTNEERVHGEVTVEKAAALWLRGKEQR